MARKQPGARARPDPGARARVKLLGLGLALVVLVGGGLAAFALLQARSPDTPPQASGRSAAIVDQLSATAPNGDFARDAASLLESAGYSVDYFASDQVTVDFYASLPSAGYDIVLLRVHSAVNYSPGSPTRDPVETGVGLFTGEPYEPEKYTGSELTGLSIGLYDTAEFAPVFGIEQRFVRERMQGTFNDALIVLMGCDGLARQETAEAFLERGAAAFVSWSQPVSAPHTDAATLALLERLVVQGQTLPKAVRGTAAEVGPDPNYGGELRLLTRAELASR